MSNSENSYLLDVVTEEIVDGNVDSVSGDFLTGRVRSESRRENTKSAVAMCEGRTNSEGKVNSFRRDLHDRTFESGDQSIEAEIDDLGTSEHLSAITINKSTGSLVSTSDFCVNSYDELSAQPQTGNGRVLDRRSTKETKGLVMEDLMSTSLGLSSITPQALAGPDRNVVGFVDAVTNTHIRGWAWIPADVERSVEISLMLDGKAYKNVRAESFRQDLLDAEIGTGKYGFSIHLDRPIDWTTAEVLVDGFNEKIQGASANELIEKLDVFNESRKSKRQLTYYPDYSSTNPYQSKLAASLPTHWESSPGDIDEAIERIRSSATEEKHIFHLHWTNPIISSAQNEWAAERQKDTFIAKVREYIAHGGTLVWTIHNVLSHDRKHEKVERALCQEISDLATKVHVHSSLVLKEIEEIYTVRPDKIVVLEHPEYIGVYPNYIPSSDARRQLDIPQDAIVFAFVGQLRPYKGLSELIDAFRELQNAFSNVHLLIAGKPVHPYSAENIRSLTSGIDDCTLVTEFVPDNQLQVYFNACDFVVLPYRNVLTSGSVMNALSFSRPVIAPRLGVLPETIVDGENGWLYEPNDNNALLDTMRTRIEEGVLEKKELLFESCKKSVEHLTWDAFGTSLSTEIELRLEPDWTNIEVQNNIRRIKVVQSSHNRAKKREIAIVVLNYEHYDDVQRLVESIEAGTQRDIEFFIVDNDSHNLSFSEFVSFTPKSDTPTTYVRVDHNSGYALGNNIGITLALQNDFEFIWVVNPDIVMADGALDVLSNSAIENPGCNLFGSTIYAGGSNGKIWSAGGRLSFDDGLDVSHLYGGMEKSVLPTRAYPVDYVTGASLFCRASIFDVVGLIPESYFLYFEETDWCLRLRESGETILVEPRSELTHFKQSESGSLPSPYYFYYYIRNALVFTMRYKEDAYEKTLAALRRSFIFPWLTKIEQRSPEKLIQYENIVRCALQDASTRNTGYKNLNDISFPSKAKAPSSKSVGHLEFVDAGTVTGWAHDPENSDVSSDLAVLLDNQLVGHVTARSQIRRSDLQEAGLGDGSCGFRFSFPDPITKPGRHVVEVAFVNGETIGKKVIVAGTHQDYKGRIDGIAGYAIRGWVYNKGNEDESPIVEVTIDQETTVVGRAELFRKDLLGSGIGNGYHGFEIRLPACKLDGKKHSLELRLPGNETILGERVVLTKPLVASLPEAGLQDQLAWISKHREFAFEKEVDSQLVDFFQHTERALVAIGERQDHTAKISVVMPAYNREETIEASVRSVLQQSYCNFELIIVDDGSSDRTVEVVQELAANLGESRIEVVSLDMNVGVSAARNVGLERASGEFIAYLDSDNTWRKDFLLVMITGLLTSPEVESAYCGQTVFQVLQTPEGPVNDPVMVRAGPFSLALLQNRNYIDLNCFVHRKSVFEKLGGFNESIRRLVDWELIWRYGYVKTPKFIPALLSDYFMAKADNQITHLESYESNFKTIQRLFNEGRKELDEHVLATKANSRALNLVMIVNEEDEACVDSAISDAVLAIRGTESHLTILMPEAKRELDSVASSFAENSQVTVVPCCGPNVDTILEDAMRRAGDDCVLLTGSASIQSSTLKHLSEAAEISRNVGVVMSQKLKKMSGDELITLSTYASSAMPFDQVATYSDRQIDDKMKENHIVEASSRELFCALIPEQALQKISLKGCDTKDRDWIFQLLTAQLSQLHELKCFQAGRATANNMQ